jgi:hypothetical protein
MNRREIEDLARLRREVEDLRREMKRVPSTFPAPADPADDWQLLDPGGTSVLPPSGAYGVRKILTTYADITEITNLASPGTLQSGVGIAQNLRTAALAVVLNDGRSRVRRDIYRGDVFSALTGVRVLITGSSPARYHSVIVPTILRG